MMPTFPRSSLSFRTAGFPQYGWKAGFPSGAFPDRRQLKPAPGIRRPTSGLHPPFVRLVVTTVVPHCVGPQTRLRTAMEGHYSSAFYFQAFDRSVALPVAGYNYNSDWTPCMGLFLSRSFSLTRYGASIAQVSRQHLLHQHVGRLDANAHHTRQQAHHGMRSLAGFLLEVIQACALDLPDLIAHEPSALHVAM